MIDIDCWLSGQGWQPTYWAKKFTSSSRESTKWIIKSTGKWVWSVLALFIKVWVRAEAADTADRTARASLIEEIRLCAYMIPCVHIQTYINNTDIYTLDTDTHTDTHTHQTHILLPWHWLHPARKHVGRVAQMTAHSYWWQLNRALQVGMQPKQY